MTTSRIVQGISKFSIDVVTIAGCLACLFSALGFFGRYALVFELFSNFRWQYGIFLLLISLLMQKRKKLQVLFCVSAAYNLIMVGLLYIPANSAAKTESSAPHQFTLLDMNVYYENKNPELVCAEIRRDSPDVIVVEELTERLYAALQPCLGDYRYRVFTLRDDPFGIGIFSKSRFISQSDNPLKSQVSFAVSAVIQNGEKPLEIVAVHLLPPVRLNYWEFNKVTVELLAKEVQDFAGSKLIVGDLNATPWSPLFSGLVQRSGLRDSENGFGLQPSWPCGEPFLQIPIDHCLVSPDCKVLQRSLGQETGSDHRPLLVRLSTP